MMLRILSILLFSSLAWSQETILMVDNPAQMPNLKQDTGKEMFLKASVFLANDMVPISKLENKHWPQNYEQRSGDNLVLGNLRLDLAMRNNAWTMGYFHREDWRLRANRDSIEAYYFGLNSQLKDINRSFDLNYEVEGFSADGLKLNYAWPILTASNQESGKGLLLGVSASLMQGGDLRKESTRGGLVSQVGAAAMSGVRSVSYTGLSVVPGARADGFNDFTPALPQNTESGLGYSVDLGISYFFDAGGVVSFAVNDVIAKLDWAGVPQIQQRVNNLSDPFVFSNGGAATFERVSSYTDVILKPSPKYRLEGVLPVGEKWILSGRVETIDSLWFPQLGMGYLVRPNWRLGLDYETRFGAVGVSLHHPNYFISLSSQSLSLNESSAIGFSAGMSYLF